VRRLFDEAQRFLDHKAGCEWKNDWHACTCGLAALLDALDDLERRVNALEEER